MGSLLMTNTWESPLSHSHLFTEGRTGKRDQIQRTVLGEEVSLGLVDPTTGRSLLYHLLTVVTNGDKIVLKKLDTCVSPSCDGVDDDDYHVIVEQQRSSHQDSSGVRVYIIYFNHSL